MDREIKRAERHNLELSLLFLDLDDFKLVNDSYGHLVGDEVLKEVAHRLKNVVRIYDIVGRYGGEEFLIILPDTDLENAKTLTERARKAIKEPSISDIRVTISLGITCMKENDQSIKDLIERADEGLYRAKNSGKDCAVHFLPDIQS